MLRKNKRLSAAEKTFAAEKGSDRVKKISLFEKKLLCITATTLILLALAALAQAENVNYENAVEKYYDIDFENDSWESAQGNSTINPNTDGHFKPLTTFEQDPVKGNTVVKITGSGSGGNYGCIRDKSMSITSIRENIVIWYELSFKFIDKASAIRLEAGEYPFMITEEGKLLIGGLDAGGYVGAEIANLTLQPGEWYHLVVAVDNIDKWAGSDVKYYAWLNGELLTTGETPMTGCTVSKGYASSVGNFGYWFFIPSDGRDIGVYFDDIKVYTTASRVKDNGEFCFDPMNIFEGAVVTSDLFRVEDNIIYAPSDETVAELSEYLKAGDSGIGFLDKTEAIDDKNAVVTSAVGKTVIARSDSGIGVKKYMIEEGNRLYTIESATWMMEDETVIDKVSDLKAEDKVFVQLGVQNETSSEKTGVLVLAAYNGTALAGCSFKDISIPAGGDTVKSEVLEINNAENLTLKAYVWESSENYTPVLTRVELAN